MFHYFPLSFTYSHTAVLRINNNYYRFFGKHQVTRKSDNLVIKCTLQQWKGFIFLLSDRVSENVGFAL